jgi:hypothetical protein
LMLAIMSKLRILAFLLWYEMVIRRIQ